MTRVPISRWGSCFPAGLTMEHDPAAQKAGWGARPHTWEKRTHACTDSCSELNNFIHDSPKLERPKGPPTERGQTVADPRHGAPLGDTPKGMGIKSVLFSQYTRHERVRASMYVRVPLGQSSRSRRSPWWQLSRNRGCLGGGWGTARGGRRERWGGVSLTRCIQLSQTLNGTLKTVQFAEFHAASV